MSKKRLLRRLEVREQQDELDMTINSLPATSPIASPRDAGREKKAPAAPSGFESLLQSVSGAAGTETVSPRVAAEMLRVQMMQSTLALAVSDSASNAASGATPPPVPGLEFGLGLPGAYRGSAVLETEEAEGEPIPSRPASIMGGTAAEIDHISETAARYLGTPYRFGGEGADGIDCSSFVQQVFHANQIDLPRTAREQINVGRDVAPSELRKGDLVFFQTYAEYPSHVGIYLGDGKMIHASSGKGEVTISDMNSDYYRPRYLGAKRVI